MTPKLTPNDVHADHEALLKNEKMLAHLSTERHFNAETIKVLQIGWVEHGGFEWFSFPIFDEHGECKFKKLKKPPTGPTLQDKGMVYPSGRKAMLYPLQLFDEAAEDILIGEGEPDIVAARSIGLHAFCGTAGAKTFDREWLSLLKRGKVRRCYLCMDHDETGRAATVMLIELLLECCPEWEISIVAGPQGFPEKGDLTDFLRQHAGENPAGALLGLSRRYLPPSPQERLRSELREYSSRHILPVQAFHDGIAYYTVALERRGETSLYTITSKREIFPCTPDAFAERKLSVLRLPLLDTSRWTQTKLLDYLEGAEPMSLGDLFNVLNEMVLKAYVDLPDPRFYACITLWIIATYFCRIFHAFPYLHLYGEFHSGKTKVLQIAVLLSFNGEMLTSTTAAALVRLIHFNGATCGIDEAEKLENDRDEAAATLLQILRCGYKKGATVPRCEESDSGFKVVRYDPYSPKVIAGTKPLEGALSSRCIQVLMLRSKNHQVANREVNVGSTDWSDYRSLLYAAALSSCQDVHTALSETEMGEVIGRDAEIWRPLLVVAKVVDPSGELFQEMLTLAKETQALRQQEDEDTATPKVIVCLHELLKGKECDFLPAETIFEALLACDEEFGWLNDPKFKHSRGRWLNRTLKKINLWRGPARLKSVYGEKKKGYDLEAAKLREIADRYSIPLATTPSEAVTTVTDSGFPF